MDANSIIAEYTARKAVFDDFANRMLELLRRLVKRSAIRTQSIEGRIKSMESLRGKLARPGTSYSVLDDVTDICGLRIITFFAADVDKIAELLRGEFDIDSQNSTDRRAFSDPDRFGYQSLHYVLSLKDGRIALPEYESFRGYNAEVQIRTIIQHAWAEIEHDLGYKNELAVPKNVKRRLFRLAAMLEIADDEFTAIHETQTEYRLEVKRRLKSDLANINIDGTSIAEFVNSDTVVRQTEQVISQAVDRPLTPLPADGGPRIATWLSYTGFKTLQDVRIDLERFRKDIVRVATQRISGKSYSSVGSGTSLLYLCYAALAYGVPNSQKILRFLQENAFGPAEQLPGIAADMYRAFTNHGELGVSPPGKA